VQPCTSRKIVSNELTSRATMKRRVQSHKLRFELSRGLVQKELEALLALVQRGDFGTERVH